MIRVGDDDDDGLFEASPREREEVHGPKNPSSKTFSLEGIHQQPHTEGGHQGGQRHGENPGGGNVGKEAPVDALLALLRPTDEDHRADLAVGGADRQADLAGHQDGDGRPDLDGEARAGGDLGQVVAHRPNHPAAPGPEADADAQAAVEENVGRRAAGGAAVLVEQEDGHQGTDGIAGWVGGNSREVRTSEFWENRIQTKKFSYLTSFPP